MNGQVPWFSSAQNIWGHDLLADFLRKLAVPTVSWLWVQVFFSQWFYIAWISAIFSRNSWICYCYDTVSKFEAVGDNIWFCPQLSVFVAPQFEPFWEGQGTSFCPTSQATRCFPLHTPCEKDGLPNQGGSATHASPAQEREWWQVEEAAELDLQALSVSRSFVTANSIAAGFQRFRFGESLPTSVHVAWQKPGEMPGMLGFLLTIAKGTKWEMSIYNKNYCTPIIQ